MATCEVSTDRWPTPKGTDGERGGRGDLLAKARGYQMAHNGTLMGDLRQLTLFAAAFPVSRTASPVAVLPVPTTAISGRSSLDSFASLNPDGSWRKTCQGYSQVTLDGSLATFSGTWPRSGMTVSGTAYQRVPLAPLTDATACGSWPTPCAEDAKNVPYQKGRNGTRYLMLGGAAQLWPTPTSRDYRSDQGRQSDDELYGTKGRPLPRVVGGQLNPTWVERLMGYPTERTACAVSATRSSRRSRSGSRSGSSRRKG